MRNGLTMSVETNGHGMKYQRLGATLLDLPKFPIAVTAIMLGSTLKLGHKSITTRQMMNGSSQTRRTIHITTTQNGHGAMKIMNGISGTTSMICGLSLNMELFSPMAMMDLPQIINSRLFPSELLTILIIFIQYKYNELRLLYNLVLKLCKVVA